MGTNPLAELLEPVSNIARDIYNGFTATPLALENSAGQIALNGLFNLCKFIIKGRFKGEGNPKIQIHTVGKNYEGTCKLRMYSLRDCTYDNAISYLSKTRSWPNMTKVYKQCINLPDVQVVLKNKTESLFPITGVVKSASEITKKKSDTIEETVKQTLVGLRHRHISHGVLLQPSGGTIIYLEINSSEEEMGKLMIHKKSWSFGNFDQDPFNVDAFIGFMKAILSIMLKM